LTTKQYKVDLPIEKAGKKLSHSQVSVFHAGTFSKWVFITQRLISMQKEKKHT